MLLVSEAAEAHLMQVDLSMNVAAASETGHTQAGQVIHLEAAAPALDLVAAAAVVAAGAVWAQF
jgi:hypothetical protein